MRAVSTGARDMAQLLAQLQMEVEGAILRYKSCEGFKKNQAQVCSLLRVHLELYNESRLTPLCVTRMPPFW